jgi:dTDP-4-dehydrorhamnose reductase
MSKAVKILIAGTNGQLSRSLKCLSETAPDLDLRFFGRPNLDITDVQCCRALVHSIRPDLVLNLAAYTAVDAAESHREEAMAVNAAGAGNLALASAARKTPIVHVSTDYVFDGKKTSAYSEADRTNPINTYGASKLAGEQQVRQLNPRHIIIRTAWLYSAFGQNFVSKLLTAAAAGKPLSIVADQIGNPTSTLDLARAMIGLSRQLTGADWSGLAGIYHLVSPTPMSRHDWARMIMELSGKMSGPMCPLFAATTQDFPTPAIRPLRTVLNSARIREVFSLAFPPPEKSMREVLRVLLGKQRIGAS